MTLPEKKRIEETRKHSIDNRERQRTSTEREGKENMKETREKEISIERGKQETIENKTN